MNPNFFNLSGRKKHDVLDELLLGGAREGLVTRKELRALNRLIQTPESTGTTVPRPQAPERTKIVTDAPQTHKQRKKKTTLYLTEDIIKTLDMTLGRIRSCLPGEMRSGISRSLIVNQSLAIILQEFRAKGKNSRLMHSIRHHT